MSDNQVNVLMKYSHIFQDEKNYYNSKSPKSGGSFNLVREDFFQLINLKYLHLIGDIKNKKILDVGCGRGHLSFFLAKQGAQVTAIDLSEKFITFCKQESKQLGLDIDFLEMNALAPNFEQKSFDIVTGYRAIHHFPDLYVFFQEAYKLLKKRGFILFVEPLQKNPIVQFNRKILAPKARTRHEHPLTFTDLEKAYQIFHNLEHYEYFLLSPAAWAFRTKIHNPKIYKFSYKFLNFFEKPFLKIHKLRKYCWQTIFKCYKM